MLAVRKSPLLKTAIRYATISHPIKRLWLSRHRIRTIPLSAIVAHCQKACQVIHLATFSHCSPYRPLLPLFNSKVNFFPKKQGSKHRTCETTRILQADTEILQRNIPATRRLVVALGRYGAGYLPVIYLPVSVLSSRRHCSIRLSSGMKPYSSIARRLTACWNSCRA